MGVYADATYSLTFADEEAYKACLAQLKEELGAPWTPPAAGEDYQQVDAAEKSRQASRNIGRNALSSARRQPVASHPETQAQQGNGREHGRQTVSFVGDLPASVPTCGQRQHGAAAQGGCEGAAQPGTAQDADSQ